MQNYKNKSIKNLYKQSIKFDTQLEGINYVTLNKFLEDNIYKIEKLSGNFINNICVIIVGKGNDLNNLNKKLTYFKLPAYIHFTDSLPITSSQKIMKKDLIKKIKKEKNKNFYDLSELKRK